MVYGLCDAVGHMVVVVVVVVWWWWWCGGVVVVQAKMSLFASSPLLVPC